MTLERTLLLFFLLCEKNVLVTGIHATWALEGQWGLRDQGELRLSFKHNIMARRRHFAMKCSGGNACMFGLDAAACYLGKQDITSLKGWIYSFFLCGKK